MSYFFICLSSIVRTYQQHQSHHGSYTTCQPVPHGNTSFGSRSKFLFNALPQTEMVVDIHCVTTWSKFDTRWRGVTVDDLLRAAGVQAPTPWVLAHSLDGYSTNVPLADLAGGRALVATHFDDQPLSHAHGGPARLLVPHLYFWKSAKWVSALQFTPADEAGFWELRGYHMRGDPFQEERYG